jgi:glycosyltransferase involved in cell wall biosynthesis
MAHHLRSEGHEVTIVATDAFGVMPEDDELRVVRVRDLRASALARRLLGRGELPTTGSRSVESPPRRLLTEVIVPDVQALAWVPAALATVRRLTSSEPIDCLVTSSPNDSTHLIGALLGRRRPAWVAEFRDAWGSLRPRFPTGPQRTLDTWLEARIAQTVEVVIAATQPIADGIEVRLGVQASCVPNGWDPDSAGAHISPTIASPSLVYTGTFRHPGSDSDALLHALSIVTRETDLRLVIAGTLADQDATLIRKLGLGSTIDFRGRVSRSESLALQRAGTALLLLTSHDPSVATSKLFEYIGAGRPIVALAQGNEAARIVRETNTGITVPPDDVQAIAAALRTIASGELAAAFTPRNLEQFTYPHPAERMAEAIEAAIARRAAQR